MYVDIGVVKSKVSMCAQNPNMLHMYQSIIGKQATVVIALLSGLALKTVTTLITREFDK